MYNKILVPLDGNFSKEIAENTLDLIGNKEIEVIALYVIDDSTPLLTPKSISEQMIKELRVKSKEILSEFKNLLNLDAHSNIKFRELVLEGRPADWIIDTAKKDCVDVIVMGTSKSIVDKHLLGSVSEEVVHFAPCTVHLVRTFDSKACEL
jgi:nucleotide-binding universal stress UspA family protein